VDESAESVEAHDRVRWRFRLRVDLRRIGRALAQALVWSGLVIVAEEVAQDGLEMAGTKDER
jgi:hypothetical protein